MRVKKISAICLSACVALFGILPSVAYASQGTVERAAGETRFETMQKIADRGFDKADTVVIASGDNFPDALSASSLAGIYQSPVLLTSANSLSDATKHEIEKLKPRKAILVGGPSAIGHHTEWQIKSLIPAVRRIAGQTRIDTARQIYSENKDKMSNKAIIATSNNFADALAIAPYAYSSKTPVFLTDAFKLDAKVKDTLNRGNFSDIFILGGTSAVSSAVERDIRTNTTSRIQRIQGRTRYETSLNIARNFMKAGDQLILATGDNFADALAGGALAGKLNFPLLLVDNNSLGTVDNIHSVYPSANSLTVLGGKNAVHTRTVNYLSHRYFNRIAEKPDGRYVSGYIKFNRWCKKKENGYYGYTDDGNVLQCKYIPNDEANLPRWRYIF